MNGKENIINKILSEADAKCAEILATANAQAQAIVDDAQRIIQADRTALTQRLQDIAAERTRNRLATAELEAKKHALWAKQQLISRCYDLAYDKLVHMSPNDRLTFIGKLLNSYAEDGETVYVTQTDAKLVTQQWLDGFGKKLKLGSRLINADGGVILEGKGYEKDLTLASVIKYIREQTESKVAAILLGE